jgi:sugar lactone lactonase YvrE
MKRFSGYSKTILVLFMCMILAPSSYAGIPYATFTASRNGRLTRTQTAYQPLMTITRFSDDAADYSLNIPSDIRVGPDGYLYIADTGNKRILVSSIDGRFIRTIGEGVLDTPKGVFVTEAGLVYAADETKQCVFVFNREGGLVREYGKPVHPLFGRYAQYQPQKVAVDKRGNVYITSKGNTNGVIQISGGDDADFLGYFGANTTVVTLQTMFRRLFYSHEQRSKLANVLPITVSNITIDGEGLIYTVSRGASENPALKKLNVAGRNTIEIDSWDPDFIAVSTNKSGNIYAATIGGQIYEYDKEGDLIFIFGATDDGSQRVGLFNTISGLVAADDGRLFVLDEQKNAVQVFTPTEFTKVVHQAFELFNEGKYLESKEPWTEIIKMNSMFAYANIGLGEAHYREKEYTEALAAFRLGNSHSGYSDAFWELRSDWLKNNLGVIILVIAGLLVVWQVLQVLDRRYMVLAPARNAKTKIGNVKLISDCLFTFHNIKNPADTCYGIKRENRGSWLSAFVLILIFYVLFVVEKYFSGFLFKTVRDGYYDLVGDAVTILVVFGLGIISCYLVCTITEGEASFKNLFIGIVYAFAPIFFLGPVVIIMTNVLTQGEAFFVTFVNFVAYGWTAVLVFAAIMFLNDYTVLQTIRTIILTIFTALIITLLMFILYMLITQMIDFISSVIGEAVFKIANS